MKDTKYKYLGFITCLYITFQIISDVTAGKIIDVFSFPVSVTVLYFPVTYIFSDILTEVYGYERARNVLWTVMISSIIAGGIFGLVALIPGGTGFSNNEAYRIVLGQVPRILVGGWIAVFAGDIVNNFCLAKMKIMTQGKFLWLRTITSTILGQFVNTTLFYIIALYGILPTSILLQAIVTGWVIKVIVEIVFTPITYIVVNKLKTVEGIDKYDTDANFNPFTWKPPF